MSFLQVESCPKRQGCRTKRLAAVGKDWSILRAILLCGEAKNSNGSSSSSIKSWQTQKRFFLSCAGLAVKCEACRPGYQSVEQEIRHRSKHHVSFDQKVCRTRRGCASLVMQDTSNLCPGKVHVCPVKLAAGQKNCDCSVHFGTHLILSLICFTNKTC